MAEPKISDADEFIDLAIRSRLVGRDDIDRAREAALSADNTSITLDRLCESLVAQNLLTAWQCEKLRNGQYKGFFFERRFELMDRLGNDDNSVRYLAFDLSGRRNVTLRIFRRERSGNHPYEIEPG